MKSLTEYPTFTLPDRMAFVNITPRLEELVHRSGIKEGLLLCNAMHITASVFINDDERGLHEDFKKWLERLASFDVSPQTYFHDELEEKKVPHVWHVHSGGGHNFAVWKADLYHFAPLLFR